MKTKRHQRQPLRSGTLTLLLTCVIILLAVLSLLSLVTAQADLKLADRQLVYAQRNAEADRSGAEWLADLDDYLRGGGELPADTTADEGTFAATLYVADNASLAVTARQTADGKIEVTSWQLLTDWTPSGASETETEALESGSTPDSAAGTVPAGGSGVA